MKNVKECEYLFTPILNEQHCEFFCKEKQEFEVGRLCLEVYEKLESPLKKMGVKIMLNIYDAADCYIRENQKMVLLCMSTMICYLLSKCPTICTMVISSKLKKDEIWVSFYEESNMTEKMVTEIENNSHGINGEEKIDLAMKRATEYMEENNFKSEIAKSDFIWKIGIGFPIVKKGV